MKNFGVKECPNLSGHQRKEDSSQVETKQKPFRPIDNAAEVNNNGIEVLTASSGRKHVVISMTISVKFEYLLRINLAMGRPGGLKCAVKDCKSKYLDNNQHTPLRFFRFPNPRTQEVRMNSWQLACNDELLTRATDPMKLYGSMRICSLHFEDHLIEKHKLKENAVPILNLVAPYIYEEHSYFSDENIEVGHFMEIDDSSEDGMDTRARSIGTQTEPDMVDTGTQTLVQKSDFQVQTEKQLSAITPKSN
ncbi:unnamed protein product [Phaedon cochleariae]|uniref:THAP-type domain-containing protein n=1 Tax=Phaedon cochleariae TaxID=80249 RepID=A0A9N9X529_PHACE|nr:unnamed protein product [Phaedon cochleariae]